MTLVSSAPRSSLWHTVSRYALDPHGSLVSLDTGQICPGTFTTSPLISIWGWGNRTLCMERLWLSCHFPCWSGRVRVCWSAGYIRWLIYSFLANPKSLAEFSLRPEKKMQNSICSGNGPDWKHQHLWSNKNKKKGQDSLIPYHSSAHAKVTRVQMLGSFELRKGGGVQKERGLWFHSWQAWKQLLRKSLQGFQFRVANMTILSLHSWPWLQSCPQGMSSLV